MVGGRTVKVDSASPAVTQLRERPSTYIQPEVRQERVINHVTVYHYQHPYDYYWGRPVGYGIGPYSNGFWWMMMEWDAQRRADWLYHNQARLSAEAYAEGARDAAVQQRLAALEAQKVPRDVNYVDPEFASDPTDQYDQNYVEAAYNPTVMPVQTTRLLIPRQCRLRVVVGLVWGQCCYGSAGSVLLGQSSTCSSMSAGGSDESLHRGGGHGFYQLVGLLQSLRRVG